MKAWTWFLSTALIAFSMVGAAPVWGQDRCTAFSDEEIIESLPPGGLILEGNTCDKKNLVKQYDSDTCRIPSETYEGGEVAYKLRLNEGNEVSFFLDVQEDADLVLALLSDCDRGNKCVSSSTDFIGSRDEEIPSAAYKPPGIYYLYIDTHTKEKEPAVAACGPYKLTISGRNPVPVLSTRMTGHLPTAPATSNTKATAGRQLVYELAIENSGSAGANNVRTDVTLESPDLSFVSAKDFKCLPTGNVVSCNLGAIAAGSTKTLSMTVNVAAKAETKVRSTVSVVTDSGISAHTDLITTVEHISDLSVRMSAPPGEAIAGKVRAYTLSLRNDGPSDATQVEVVSTLDEDEEFVATDATVACHKGPGLRQVLCKLERIPAHGTASPSFDVLVRSSATDFLSDTAKVGTVTGSDPIPNKGPNQSSLETPVGRETDFMISKIETFRDSHVETGPIGAGADFTYVVTIKNLGPSDSSGASLTITAPPGLSIQHQGSLGKQTAGQETSVSFPAKTLPSMQPTAFTSFVTVKGNEREPSPNKGVNEFQIKTAFKIEADLELLDGTPTDVSGTSVGPTVCAGTILLYTFGVVNNGPSDSRGGKIHDELPASLSFVSSPDGCSFDEKTKTVTCPVQALAVGAAPFRVRFLAVPRSESVETIGNTASIVSDHDEKSGNDQRMDSREVGPASDLVVTLNASQDLVAPGGLLTYSVAVTNRGPSKRIGATVDFVFEPPAPDATIAGNICRCQSLPCSCDLDAGVTDNITVTRPGPFDLNRTLKASVSAAAGGGCEPANDNQADATTRVVDPDTDFGLTLTADRDTAVVGDPLVYTIEVTRRGANATLTTPIAEILPPGVAFVGTEPDNACSNGVGVPMTCTLTPDQPLKLTVRVVSAAGGKLENTISFTAQPDSNVTDNTASLTIPVLQIAPLVLPFFEVAESGSPVSLTTLYSVRNPVLSAPAVLYEYQPVSSQPDLDPVSLGLKATRTVNLRDSLQLRGTTGYLGITPTNVKEEERHSLVGDFLRVDPARASATGERLISTDTSRIPSELCDSWSVRFLRGQPAGSSTDLLFFVPGNPGGVVATGRVFTESGIFVQTVTIEANEQAFRRSINTRDDGGLPLLAASGSIEWTFAPGLVGNITAVHKLGGKDEAAVPGFCRSHARDGKPSLLLPFFELDRSQLPAGLTTLVALRNETVGNVDVLATVYPEAGTSVALPTLHLRGHETWTANLRDLTELANIDKGSVMFEASTPAVLSGDFIRVGPEGRSGAALVDTSIQLCQRWSTRFVGLANTETRFLVHVEEMETIKVDAFDEKGTMLPATPPIANSSSFLVSASLLGLAGSGSVEWDLGAKGYVTTLLTGQGAGRYSVLIPGACLDRKPD
jgi:uncharacterized repeat protein (TIGR01451 family)